MVGEVFWTGESRYGPGMRYGVKDGEETYWVDEENVEVIAAAEGGAGGGGGTSDAEEPPPAGPMPMDDAVPSDGDLPPEAFEEENYSEDDIPF